MCENVDNWCMEEKRGCKGCYFEDNETLHKLQKIHNKSAEIINNKLNKEEN